MKKSKMGNLEKYLPKIKEGYYANKEEPEFAAKERLNFWKMRMPTMSF